MLNSLIDTDEYYTRFFDIYRRDYLDGILQSQIEDAILTLQFFYDQYVNDPDPLLQALAAALLIEIEKMELLQSAASDYSVIGLMMEHMMCLVMRQWLPVHNLFAMA